MPVNIHGKEYATVAERVKAFYIQFPDGYIHTKLAYQDDTRVIMRATIGIQGVRVPLGIDYAEEERGSSQINTTSALENCSTSAIGRALAAANFGGSDQYASANEVANAIHQQDRQFNPSDPDTPVAEWIYPAGNYKGETLAWIAEKDPKFAKRYAIQGKIPEIREAFVRLLEGVKA